jgi:hypothetical protein
MMWRGGIIRWGEERRPASLFEGVLRLYEGYCVASIL